MVSAYLPVFEGEFKELSDADFLKMAFCENDSAIRFYRDLIDCSDELDNLVDEPGVEVRKRVYRVTHLMLFEIPRNPFYQSYFHLLNPILLSVLHAWKIATELESRKSADLCELSHVLRYGVCDLFPVVAEICGGREHAEKVGPEARIRSHRENLTDYQKEHTDA